MLKDFLSLLENFIQCFEFSCNCWKVFLFEWFFSTTRECHLMPLNFWFIDNNFVYLMLLNFISIWNFESIFQSGHCHLIIKLSGLVFGSSPSVFLLISQWLKYFSKNFYGHCSFAVMLIHYSCLVINELKHCWLTKSFMFYDNLMFSLCTFKQYLSTKMLWEVWKDWHIRSWDYIIFLKLDISISFNVLYSTFLKKVHFFS